MTTNNYLLRTLLFVPGHNDKLITSASRSIADALVFDLEDSVLPFERKEDARINVKKWVIEGNLEHDQVFVRVNDIASGILIKDLHTLTLEGVTGFLYPKTRNGEDIFFIDRLLEAIEYEKGYPIGKFKIIPIIEGAAAVLNGQEICQSSKRVIALAFGSADFITDLRGILDDARESLNVPRALIALAARANGVYPIDTSFNNVHDLDGLEYNLKIAKKLGFEGMSVLHPKQIELAHQYFTPSPVEVDNANELLRLNKLAIQESRGVAIKDGKFVGPPLIDGAKNLLAKYELIKKKGK
jgi:citrate lyase subunit beta / citryl-CoA lyase